MNSLKSVCSFANGIPVLLDEIQKDVEAFLRAQTSVVCVLGAPRLLEAVEDLADMLH